MDIERISMDFTFPPLLHVGCFFAVLGSLYKTRNSGGSGLSGLAAAQLTAIALGLQS